MLERFITAAQLFGPASELSPEERKVFRKLLPGLSARRLSDGSLAIAAITNDAGISPDDDFVFGSVVGGTVSLQAFLESFPNPSPASFQGSTHAGVVEAVLVARQLPVRRFQSVANPASSVVPATLRSALLSTAEIVHLLLAEERGDWLSGVDVGYPSTFASYLRLERAPRQPLGKITFDPAAETSAKGIETPAFCEHIHRRKSFDLASIGPGMFSITWQQS